MASKPRFEAITDNRPRIEALSYLPKKCLECGKELDSILLQNKRRKFCSKRCKNRYDVRIWKKTHFLRFDYDYKLIELAKRQEISHVLKKKDFCEACGRTRAETSLLLHEVRYEPRETVTLCPKCHGRLHSRFLRRKKVKLWFSEV